MSRDILVGCSGYQKSHEVYYQNFQLVEIQQTFYKPPRLETAKTWRLEAPKEFIFIIKAYQAITHDASIPTYRRSGLTIPPENRHHYGYFRDTEEVKQAWVVTREIGEILESPVILFQCPPQFTPTINNLNNLRHFFKRIDRGKFKLAWEPRGRWSDQTILELCHELDLIHVIDPFIRPTLYGQIHYFRMHGGKDYQHQYTEEELDYIYQRCPQDRTSYCLFNNRTMWDDGLRFKNIIS